MLAKQKLDEKLIARAQRRQTAEEASGRGAGRQQTDGRQLAGRIAGCILSRRGLSNSNHTTRDAARPGYRQPPSSTIDCCSPNTQPSSARTRSYRPPRPPSRTRKAKRTLQPFESAIPDLENAIIGQIEVPDLELQALGKKRTRAIQDVLLAEGGIDASRVFIINGASKTDDSGNVRVEMALK